MNKSEFMNNDISRHHLFSSRIAVDFSSWRKNHLSDKTFVLLLAGVVGLLTGVGAFVMKRLVAGLSAGLTSHLRVDSGNPTLLLLPIVGIVLTGIFCRYVVGMNLANGTSRLMKRLRHHVYKLKRRLVVAPVIASVITLGFGGSGGTEDPIACAGAALGSNVARRFGLSPRQMLTMIGCGACGSIAGIFKSPLGGVMFVVEVLRLPLTAFSLISLFVAAIVASSVAFLLSGGVPDVAMRTGEAFDLSMLPSVMLLGVVCGVYSIYYRLVLKRVARRFDGISNPWIKNLTGGCLLAVLVFLLPPLYGEGYAVVDAVVNGDFAPLLADSLYYKYGVGNGDEAWTLIAVGGAIVVTKCVATSITGNSGGVCGDFAPTLFAGCMLGFTLGTLLETAFGLHIDVGRFAFFGMAGVMAGVIRAPLMAMFLTCEMTAAYGLFLPLMLVAVTSSTVVRLFTADSFYARTADRNNGLISRLRRKF